MYALLILLCNRLYMYSVPYGYGISSKFAYVMPQMCSGWFRVPCMQIVQLYIVKLQTMQSTYVCSYVRIAGTSSEGPSSKIANFISSYIANLQLAIVTPWSW